MQNRLSYLLLIISVFCTATAVAETRLETISKIAAHPSTFDYHKIASELLREITALNKKNERPSKALYQKFKLKMDPLLPFISPLLQGKLLAAMATLLDDFEVELSVAYFEQSLTILSKEKLGYIDPAILTAIEMYSQLLLRLEDHYQMYYWAKKGLTLTNEFDGDAELKALHLRDFKNRLAIAYYRLKLFDLAIELLQENIATSDPMAINTVLGKANLGTFYFDADQPELGIASYKQAISDFISLKEVNYTIMMTAGLSTELFSNGHVEQARFYNKKIKENFSLYSGESLYPFTQSVWYISDLDFALHDKDWQNVYKIAHQIIAIKEYTDKNKIITAYKALARYYQQQQQWSLATATIENVIGLTFANNIDYNNYQIENIIGAEIIEALVIKAESLQEQQRYSESHALSQFINRIHLFNSKKSTSIEIKNAQLRVKIVLDVREAKAEQLLLFNQHKTSAYVIIALVIALAIYIVINRQKRQYFKLSRIDTITGLGNIKAFEEHILGNNNQLFICYIRLSGLITEIENNDPQWLAKLAGLLNNTFEQDIAGQLSELYYLGASDFAFTLCEQGQVKIDVERISVNIELKFNKNLFPQSIEVLYNLNFAWLHCQEPQKADFQSINQHLATTLTLSHQDQSNNVKLFDQQLEQFNLDRLFISQQLLRATQNNFADFFLLFQPKVDTITGKIYGAEALLRWQCQGRTISPVEFIPLMEKSGIIITAGEWIITQACQKLKSMQQRVNQEFTLSVNVSPLQLIDLARFSQHLTHELNRFDIDPSYLEIEITEGFQCTNKDDVVKILKLIGVAVAIDDFGTGYASMKYLLGTKFDTLKIDKSITDKIDTANGQRIMSSILNLATSLDISPVVEGIETRQQLDYLQNLGCHKYQGYYFYRPLSLDELTNVLHSDMANKLGNKQSASVLPLVK